MFFSSQSNLTQMQMGEPSCLPLSSSLKDLTGQSHLSSKGSVVLSSCTLVKHRKHIRRAYLDCNLHFLFSTMMWTPTHNAMSSSGKFTNTTALVPGFWAFTSLLVQLDFQKGRLGFICILDFYYQFCFHMLSQSGYFTLYHCLLKLYVLGLWVVFEGSSAEKHGELA